MAKIIAQIIVTGGQIIARSIMRAIRQEIEISQEAAKARGQRTATAAEQTATRMGLMTLDEAKKILDVSDLSPEKVQERYTKLFEVNSKTNSGSFYLQSKVVRAKETIEHEMKQAEKAKQRKQADSEKG